VLKEFGVDPAWIETFDNDKLSEDEKRKVALSILSGQTTGIPMLEEPDVVIVPLSTEEAEDAAEALPPLTTAGDLLREMDEIPPEPPRLAPPHGPNPPEGLRFDFAWEREVVPARPADADRERIRDTSGFVPLPLGAEAVAEWTKSQAIWFHAARKKGEPFGEYAQAARVGEADYDYLFRKGHVGALERLYPADPTHPRHRSGPAFADLLTRHGFPEAYAIGKGRARRELATAGTKAAQAHPAVQRLAAEEARHYEQKDEFSRAFVAAQQKKQKS
jgi:hypothetical protein